MDERFYEQCFDEMPCYVSVQDKDLRILKTNRRFKEHFGEGVGEHCFKIYKCREERCPECSVARTFEDGKSHGSEEVVRTRNGEPVSVIVYTCPLRDERGEVVSVLEMSTDITEVKRLQKKLDESQKLHGLLFSEAPCYISVQDRDFKIVHANRRFKEDFGEEDGHCYEIYKHRTERCLDCPVALTFEDGRSHHSEEVVTSRSGERVNVVVRTAPIRDEKGEIVQVMEMSTNITEIRQLQEQLTSLGLLVSSISHGVKALLTGLRGGIYMLKTGYKKRDEARITRAWEMVEGNEARIRSMIGDILYYAKERDFDMQPVDAAKLLKDAGGLLQARAASLGVALDLRSDAAAGEFDGDGAALLSALVNLVENSLDACRVDKKKPAHAVTVGVRSDKEHILFEVSDNGIGMDQETREKAFSLFFSSKGTEGTGLGLFIANKIVTKHLGTIAIDSTEGEGTRFTVRLPRRWSAPEEKS
ncbi:MAG: PAS domain-containing sensor histidine kinase [Elusimicrobiota bacterium]